MKADKLADISRRTGGEGRREKTGGDERRRR